MDKIRKVKKILNGQGLDCFQVGGNYEDAGYKERTEWRFQEICQLFDKDNMETKRKLVEWGDSTCPHDSIRPKRACVECWQALREEVGLEP